MACQARGLRLNTERQYWDWTRRFITSRKSARRDDLLREPETAVSRFLTEQSVRGCAVSTQAQALNALVFLYRAVLKRPLGALEFSRPRRPARLPAVPGSHADTMRILDALEPAIGLLARVIYGSALRVHDALRLRIRDLDFAQSEMRIMDSKGGVDRVVPMPAVLRDDLLALCAMRESEHRAEKRAGGGWVHLPGLLGVKYPAAHHDTGWQYVFATRHPSKDPVTGKMGRHHLTPEAVQKAMRAACATLKLKRNVTPHGLRHSAARRMKEKGVPLHVIQQVLGHSRPETTMRYLGLGEAIPRGVSPLDGDA